jgi:acetyl-CoA acyltransferase
MNAYIIKGFRSAVGKAKKGGFRNYRSDDLAVDILSYLASQVPNLDPKEIDDVIVGCANPEGEQGLQVGRLIAARALGQEVPGMTINRYCASGLEAIAIAASKINAGMGHCYVAGGAESMSLLPMTGYKLVPSYNASLQNVNFHVSMGHTAEAVADKYQVTREEADAFSVRSHALAAAAIRDGKYKDEIVPVTVKEVYVENNKRVEKEFIVDTDEGVRADTTIEGLARLKPAFKVGGVVTAGNSSQTSDGAAFVLVMSEEMVNRLGLTPVARLASCAVGGVDPLYMGIGPVVAIPKALKQAGITLDDVNLIELNEAFAVQALAVIKEAGLNPDIVNVNGGAIALGHPLGCTGAKLSISIINELRRRNQKYGMVTACVGGGQGIAGIIERLDCYISDYK